ncbi:MAG: divergent polysaccharide deacetylase family protein [Thermoanaerobaculia bacterium]|nr:divergent polysaccharide deacetylase family protein [Thermoanaerobaculia bacterium]
MTRRKARAGGGGGRLKGALLVVLGVGLGAIAMLFARACARRPEAPAPAPRPAPAVPTARPAASAVARRTPAMPSDFEPVDRGPGGVLAIVIDDVGFDPPSRTLLASLAGPLALAVIPNTPHGAEAARLARKNDWDLLVHLPMDPESGRAEKDSLGPKDDDAAIRAGVLAALARLPGALGINNHQGSKATADARVVRAVLEVVKERGLFFLDSRTTTASVAGAEAAKLGVPFLARDVFLDDVMTEFADPGGAPGALEAAWEKAIALAKKRGQAIVIGHPRKETLAFLSEKIGLLGKEGPRLVRVSELVP